MADGSTPVEVWRHRGETAQWAHDQLITEHPVALVFNGLSHAVMMATPTDLEDFALGFALSEGLIERPADCHDLDVIEGPHGSELRLQVSARAFEALKAHRRQMSGRTGCGLCGIDSLQALAARHPSALPASRTTATAEAVGIGPQAVLRAIAQLHAGQRLQAGTGGCHAAAWASPDGTLRAVREDVGRHNALDKLIGHLAREERLGEPGFAVVSSRASYELVSKCVRVGIPTLAAISAPTSLAVDMARQTGLRLYGFCRGDTAVDYSAQRG
ncbi:formate dehydrogenase accessory sulfurtransferase FdhD [Aquabacterium sp.]|uniref:formate dehydrogenase accessory sulfurtransferase FdhD n=1 Tax=Aquabacterium sp. TaxID=1872578 RepID=UPI0025C366EC|nr:formate dehydrogenase accessory sulfurtransferase FdhD [Aquabacterium sp.]